MTETWTIGRLLEWTTDYLRTHGSETPRLDAEILLAVARDCERIELYTAFGEEPSEATRAAFRDMVRRRAEGMPVAYLVGHKEFFSLDFEVTPDVLIPRPTTEFLVVALLDLIKQWPAPGPQTFRMADVGTGSGCISIAALKHCAALKATAIDISAKALDLARQNALRHEVADRMDFVQGDLLTPRPAEARFEFVLSNPPYITTSEMSELSRDVLEYEPRQALEGGPEGTSVIEQLIPQAAEHLVPGGYLLMEVSPQIEPRVRMLVEEDGRFAVEAPLVDRDAKRWVVQARRSGE